ncbi:hypothetical protein MesoLj113a_65580 [Mesorhizobium sp. 113-1-2]|uniref:glycosyltransferase family 2 protein n=1 Tax=Mesorhizobium sp. 113-1-2 TaxID=2744515 RepID=UPI0008198781|nr:glycosyltransferase [Mesorhizobium sp. 113-1-2]BAV50865.1 Uncharacterized protein MLTONO_5963 [Mesorhizobium loti]BCG75400.1 hypothetical protein MesoLj113a_65580 [Mesorhizobium sp. 113-1-2]
MPALSIVLPAYNEQINLDYAATAVLKHVASVVPDLQTVVVDDGNTDTLYSNLLHAISRTTVTDILSSVEPSN